jgi:hypothetical protein
VQFYPLQQPLPIFIVIATIAALLVASYVLFRHARRDTCTWPRWLRLAVQVPGWLLVPLGFYLVIGLALEGNGLGVGTVAAMLTALGNALTRDRTT